MAASSSHSGDWLHAPPIASIGLRLSDEAVWLAVAQRLVPDTYAESHIGDTATEAGAAANQAAANKIAKYDELGRHAHLLSSFHRNRRYLESLDC